MGGEEDGVVLPLEESAGVRFVFEGNKLHIKETKAKGTSTSTGTFAIDPKKEPAEIDLKSEDKGADTVESPGIYMFDKDGRLHICFVKGKPTRPKTFNTKDTPLAIMAVLEKVTE